MKASFHYQRQPNAEDLSFVRKAMEGDKFYGPDALEADLKNKTMSLFRASIDGQHVASMAVRIDETPNGDELVIVAVGGTTPDAQHGLYKTFAPLAKALAHNLNCISCRAHASSRAVQRLMRAAGWIEAERVFRMEVA